MDMRHVRGIGRVLPAAVTAAMRGNASAFEEQLYDGCRQPDLDPLVHEAVGHAVVVVLDGDVVIGC